MKLVFKYCSLFLVTILSGCYSPTENEKLKENKKQTVTTHFNIIVVPDLSNRLLHTKPINDSKIVDVLLNQVLPKALSFRRATNQKDKYSVSFISPQAISKYSVDPQKLTISFDQFKKQLDRINYIKGKNSGSSLESDRNQFLSEYKRITNQAVASPDGADLWTYFNTGLNESLLLDSTKAYEYGGKSFINRHRNILVLLTDGYIEAGIYGNRGCINKNQCYFLSGQSVKAFRNAFKRSGKNNINEFFNQGNYGIIPVNNPALNNFEVLILQMEDRSLSASGNATVHPTDMGIMKLFWSDWLQKSKVKRFALKPIVASEAEVKKEILSFMGISS